MAYSADDLLARPIEARFPEDYRRRWLRFAPEVRMVTEYVMQVYEEMGVRRLVDRPHSSHELSPSEVAFRVAERVEAALRGAPLSKREIVEAMMEGKAKKEPYVDRSPLPDDRVDALAAAMGWKSKNEVKYDVWAEEPPARMKPTPEEVEAKRFAKAITKI